MINRLKYLERLNSKMIYPIYAGKKVMKSITAKLILEKVLVKCTVTHNKLNNPVDYSYRCKNSH